MGLRQRRRIGTGRTGVNRKAIGAAVIAGVLVVGGVSGLRLASAGEQAKASEIVVVDGQNFDIAGCEKLEINAGAVVCDGEPLAPEQEIGAAEAAAASAQALEDSCDQFAIDQAAADAEAAGAAEDGAAEEEGAAAAGMSKKAKKAVAKKYAKKMDKAEAAEKGAAKEEGAAEEGAAEEGAAEEGADAAVTDARAALLLACLDLSAAKAAAADAAGADAGAGDEDGAGDEAGAVTTRGQNLSGVRTPSAVGFQSPLSRLSEVSPAPEATAMMTKKRRMAIPITFTPLFRLFVGRCAPGCLP